MQHHPHATGPPPQHVRGPHHILAGHPPPPPTAHMAAMGMSGHAPQRPPPHQQHQQPPHQPQPNSMKVMAKSVQGQQQQSHINSKGPPPPPSTSVTSSSNLPQHQQQRHRPPQQQYPQQHMQMHNIRQQQQQQSQPYMNGNFNNNNNNNINKNNNKNSNYHQQQYNVNSAQRVQQQQQHHVVPVDQQQQQPQHRQHPRNVMPNNQHQQQQQQQQLTPQQPYMPHMKNHQHSQQTQQQQQQQKHSQTNNSRHQQQTQHHQQQVLQPKQLQQKQQQQQHKQQPNQHSAATDASTSASAGGNNTTKNNNNILKTKNFSPKSILQNPHRVIKSTSPGTVPAPAVAAAAQIVDIYAVAPPIVANNIASHSERNVVAATEHNDANIVNSSKLRNFEVDVVEDAGESSYETVTTKDELTESNKENISAAVATSSEREQLPNSQFHQILPNIDITKKGLKDKTAMCLVNELARFNQIPHQYSLVKEEGPPHSKHFSLILKLGDEEFPASANRIKTAQHNAAEQAIKYTKYKHPIPKPIRRCDENKPSRPVITPTVELNALAMKLGQPTFYIYDQPPAPQSPRTPPPTDGRIAYGGLPAHLGGAGGLIPRHAPPQGANNPYMQRRYGRNGCGAYIRPPLPPPLVHMQPQPGVGYRGGGGGYHHPASRYHVSTRYPTEDYHHPHYQHYASLNTECKVTLVVGKDKFEGIGRTMQQAKHNVAAQALKKLKEQVTERLNDDENRSVAESDSKSPISMVHEIGIKRNFNVDFKVAFEDGPAHMRHFVTECQVGHLKTQGEGNGKKISKKRAAEKMLEQLKKLPPIEAPPKTPMKRSFNKGPRTPVNGAEGGRGRDADSGVGRGERRKRSVVRERNTNDFDTSMDADADNPITKLTKIQQMLKDKEPIFTPVSPSADSGKPHKRVPFIMEVSAQGKVARGTGHNKKSAKRNAAQNLLSILESEEQGAASGSAELQESANSEGIEKTTISTMHNDSVENTSKAVNTESAVTKMSAKELLDLPVVETSAGLVPGILILRQSKKNVVKKKEISTTNAVIENKTDVVAMPATTIGVQTATTVGAQTETTETAETPIDVVVEKSNTTTTPTVDATTNVESTTDEVAPTLNDRAATIVSSTKTSDKSTAEGATTSTTTTVVSSSSSTATSSNTVLMKDQLMYLAKLLCFDVNFSDYPKGNHNEFLTIVTLSTTPPQICHGVGTSSEESQNDAAKNALKILSELGLNNTK